MKTYNLLSAPMIHTPGFFQWIIAQIRPFDIPKAEELFSALGLPEDVAGRLAKSDPAVTYSIDEEAESVRVTVSPPTESAGFTEITFTDGEIEVMAHREGKNWTGFYAYVSDVPNLPKSWQWEAGKNPLFTHLIHPTPGKAVNSLRARGFVGCG